jgi:hypothetical protein
LHVDDRPTLFLGFIEGLIQSTDGRVAIIGPLTVGGLLGSPKWQAFTKDLQFPVGSGRLTPALPNCSRTHWNY